MDLSYNNVGNDGAQALGYAMAGERTKKGKKMIKLEVLELEGNQVGNRSALLGQKLIRGGRL